MGMARSRWSCRRHRGRGGQCQRREGRRTQRLCPHLRDRPRECRAGQLDGARRGRIPGRPRAGGDGRERAQRRAFVPQRSDHRRDHASDSTRGGELRNHGGRRIVGGGRRRRRCRSPAQRNLGQPAELAPRCQSRRERPLHRGRHGCERTRRDEPNAADARGERQLVARPQRRLKPPGAHDRKVGSVGGQNEHRPPLAAGNLPRIRGDPMTGERDIARSHRFAERLDEDGRHPAGERGGLRERSGGKRRRPRAQCDRARRAAAGDECGRAGDRRRHRSPGTRVSELQATRAGEHGRRCGRRGRRGQILEVGRRDREQRDHDRARE